MGWYVSTNRYLAPMRAAFEAGRLDDFLAEQQAMKIGPSERDALDRALLKVIKEHQARRRASITAKGMSRRKLKP
jgi:hypothetical protein